jgi:hypothetical protein
MRFRDQATPCRMTVSVITERRCRMQCFHDESSGSTRLCSPLNRDAAVGCEFRVEVTQIGRQTGSSYLRVCGW